MTDEEKIARGARAGAIVSDPLFKESMAKLKQEIVDTWAAAPARDKEGREWLWSHYQAACKFEEAFVSMLNDGKLAEDALKQKKRDNIINRAVNYWQR